jgi:hypothetical protein
MYYEEGKRSGGTYNQDFEVKSYSGAGGEKSGIQYESTSQESKVLLDSEKISTKTLMN